MVGGRDCLRCQSSSFGESSFVLLLAASNLWRWSSRSSKLFEPLPGKRRHYSGAELTLHGSWIVLEILGTMGETTKLHTIPRGLRRLPSWKNILLIGGPAGNDSFFFRWFEAHSDVSIAHMRHAECQGGWNRQVSIQRSNRCNQPYLSWSPKELPS